MFFVPFDLYDFQFTMKVERSEEVWLVDTENQARDGDSKLDLQLIFFIVLAV